MSTSYVEEQYVVDEDAAVHAVEVTDTQLEVTDLEQTILIDGESTDCFTITVEPVTETLLAELEAPGTVLVVTESVFLISESIPGAQGLPGPPTVLSVYRIPLEAVNNSRVTFTAPANYLSNSLVVTLNGLVEPITEVAPNMFTFYDPPLVGDTIYLQYQGA